MAYVPIQNPPWDLRDGLKSGNPGKRIMAEDFATEFTNIQTEFNRVQTEFDRINSAGNANVASCKFNGSQVVYGHNVPANGVSIPPDPMVDLDGNARPGAPHWDNSWLGACQVRFENQIPEFDHHYAVVIQPYATGQKHVIATVTDQRSSGVEWTWMEWDGTQWITPAVKLGFSLIVVDMVQN